MPGHAGQCVSTCMAEWWEQALLAVADIDDGWTTLSSTMATAEELVRARKLFSAILAKVEVNGKF